MGAGGKGCVKIPGAGVGVVVGKWCKAPDLVALGVGTRPTARRGRTERAVECKRSLKENTHTNGHTKQSPCSWVQLSNAHVLMFTPK